MILILVGIAGCLDSGPGLAPDGSKTSNCPTLTVTAEPGPVNQLAWTSVPDADGYILHRATGDGAFEPLTSVGGGTLTFDDGDVQPGQTYRYMATAHVDGVESDDCPVREVTAVPTFPTPIGLAAATVLGVAAYVTCRARHD